MTAETDLYSRVRSLLAAEPETPDDGTAPVGSPGRLDGRDSRSSARLRLRRTCRAAARGLEADGAGICLWAGDGGLVTAAASDLPYAEVEELQFVIGEGPCLTAFARRTPVLVPDLRDLTELPWTAYPARAASLGIRAVFAFPLQLGGARLGVLDVYRRRPGPLSPDALGLALTFAEVAFLDLVQEVTDTGQAQTLADSAAANRYEVYQAQGMVMVQLGIGADEALLRLRAHAFAHDVPIVALARDVIRRRVTLLEHDEDDH